MATPVSGGVIAGKGGGVKLVLNPPVEFILRQSGAFQAALVMEMDKLFEAFKPVMGALESEWFDSNGHGEWPELAPSTVARKGHATILVDTGDLRASLVDPGRAMQIHGTSAEYGTDVEYAHWHQDGGYVAGRPPQRQVIPDPLPVETRRLLEREMVKWVDVLSAKTWGRV